MVTNLFILYGIKNNRYNRQFVKFMYIWKYSVKKNNNNGLFLQIACDYVSQILVSVCKKLIMGW